MPAQPCDVTGFHGNQDDVIAGIRAPGEGVGRAVAEEEPVGVTAGVWVSGWVGWCADVRVGGWVYVCVRV